MNYKELSAEWPNEGQLCQVYRPDDSKQVISPTAPCVFYATFGFEDGIPVWKGISPMRKPANPKDNWMLARILSTDGTQPEMPAQEQQDQCESPADPKVNFKVEDGLLVGEKTGAEWCISLPVSEAYDVLVDHACRFGTPPHPAQKMPDLRIKELEERNGRQESIIRAQVDQIEQLNKLLKQQQKLNGIKNDKIDYLMVKNMELTARLNQPD